MPTNIPLTPVYTGEIALRSDPENFDENAENQYTYLALFSTDWNVTITAMNTAIGETQGYADSAGASASSASDSAASSASSALISESNANFKGKWDDATGASTVPASYWHNGSNWQLLVNVADITATEPTPDNADYSVIITPALSEPDVKISFNDGITMERGYGTADSNGNRAIDFTRASASGNINKSGVSVDLVVDEAGITSDGLSVYGEVTNELLWSEDFSNAVWGKEGSPVLSTDGTLWVDRATLATKFEVTTSSGFRSLRVTSSPSLDGETWCSFIYAKAGSLSEFRIEAHGVGGSNTSATFNLIAETAINNGNLNSASIKALNDGWFLCSCSYTKTQDNGQLKIVDLSYQTTVAGDYIYILGAQASKIGAPTAPYIKTEATVVTRAPDIASIPMMNNMPAAGMPFTILATAFTAQVGAEEPVIANERSSVMGFSLNRSVSGRIQVGMSNGTSLVFASELVSSTNAIHLLGFVYNGSSISLYVDGVLSASSAFTLPPVYDLLTDISVGSSGAFYLNSEIKNFEIFHKALSSEEIAARGGPK